MVAIEYYTKQGGLDLIGKAADLKSAGPLAPFGVRVPGPPIRIVIFKIALIHNKFAFYFLISLFLYIIHVEFIITNHIINNA